MNDRQPELVELDINSLVEQAMERQAAERAKFVMLLTLVQQAGGVVRFKVEDLNAMRDAGLGLESSTEGEVVTLKLIACDDPTHDHARTGHA